MNKSWKTAKGNEIGIQAMDLGWICNSIAQCIRNTHNLIKDYREEKSGDFYYPTNEEIINFLNRYTDNPQSIRGRWRGLITEFELRVQGSGEYLAELWYDKHASEYREINSMPPALVMYALYSEWYNDKNVNNGKNRTWNTLLLAMRQHKIGSQFFNNQAENQVLVDLIDMINAGYLSGDDYATP